MSTIDLQNAIYAQLDCLQSGSLSFWGHWFGRPYDNIHRIVGAEASDDTAVISFDHAETLIIEAPRAWSLENGCLLVGKARSVRFQWFYYGRLPSRETLQFEEYRCLDGRVDFTTDFQPGRRAETNPSLPAVQVHTFSSSPLADRA